MAARLATLEAIETAVWRELAAAAQDRGHAWRFMALATVDGDGVDARTVVLRETDARRRELVFYSDARAGKIEQLAAHPAATALLWSPALDWQLRLRLDVEVETDGLAVTTRWARVKMTPTARDYLSPLTPGAPLQAAGTLPPAATRESFAVLTARVRSVDWLELHADGNRRARFDADGARWLQP
jgi:pyridoxamine 5'-phosphate oxidase